MWVRWGRVPRRWGQGLGDAWEWVQARCLGASGHGLVTEAGRQPRAAEAGVGDAVGGVQGLDSGAEALTLLRGTLRHFLMTPHQCHLPRDHSLVEAKSREEGTFSISLLPFYSLRKRVYSSLWTLDSGLLIHRGPEKESDLPKVTQWQVDGPDLWSIR